MKMSRDPVVTIVFKSDFKNNNDGFLIYYQTVEGMNLYDNRLQDSSDHHTGHTQSTLVISTSVISNNRLSRRENLIRVLT